MYRLLALDLDGTLLTPELTVTPRTVTLLEQAAQKGLRIMIATGRAFAGIKHFCGHLPLTGPQISDNGAVITDFQTEEKLQELFFPEEELRSTLKLITDYSLEPAYHTREGIYSNHQLASYVNLHFPLFASMIGVDDVTQLIDQIRCIKLIALADENIIRQQRAAIIQELYGRLYVTQTSEYSLEFLHPEVAKGKALAKIAQQLDIAPEEIIAIGDNHNDLEMLKFAGYSIAMGNAHAEVQAITHQITRRNTEEGVAYALEHFILPQLEA